MGNIVTYTDANGTATYTYEVLGSNIMVVGTPAEYAWSIAPKTLTAADVAGYAWNNPTYTGAPLTGTIVLPDSLEVVKYEFPNNCVNAGEYTATVTIASVQNANGAYNYNFISGGVVSYEGTFENLTWRIEKADISDLRTLVQLVGKTVNYDSKKNQKLEVSLTNTALNDEYNRYADLLKYLNVSYFYDGVPNNLGANLVKTYRVTASVALVNHPNFNDASLDQLGPVNFVITGDKVSEFQLSGGTVIVEAVGGLTPDHTLNAKKATHVKPTYEIDDKNAVVIISYDIFFTKGLQKIPANVDGREFIVKILIPESQREIGRRDQFQVIHVNEDGTFEIMNATREGNYMVFTTDHFSEYAIVRV